MTWSREESSQTQYVDLCCLLGKVRPLARTATTPTQASFTRSCTRTRRPPQATGEDCSLHFQVDIDSSRYPNPQVKIASDSQQLIRDSSFLRSFKVARLLPSNSPSSPSRPRDDRCADKTFLTAAASSKSIPGFSTFPTYFVFVFFPNFFL